MSWTTRAVEAHIAEAVRRSRRARGWSQRELAEAINVSRRQVGRIEDASASVDALTLYAICGALDVRFADVFPPVWHDA